MQQSEQNTSKTIKDIIFIVKKNLVLILLLVFLGGACGIGYSYIKKPNYVATANATYKAGLIMEDGKVSGGTVAEFNIMRAFVDTVLDFCDEGVVTDRANYYYVKYKNLLRIDPNYSFFNFMKFIQYDNSYNPQTSIYDVDKSHIVKEKITTTMPKVLEDQDEFFFSIKYTDENSYEAQIKCRLVVEAIKNELEKNDLGKSEYFDLVYNEVIPLYAGDWLPSVASDISKKKLTLIGAMIGGVLAVAIVYIKSAIDNSIKSKEELEEITGVAVLSVIEK